MTVYRRISDKKLLLIKEMNKIDELEKDLSYNLNWWSKYYASIDTETDENDVNETSSLVESQETDVTTTS